MKIKRVVDIIAEYLGSGRFSGGDVTLKGNLVLSDERLQSLSVSSHGSAYEHSAMPALDISFQVPVAVLVGKDGASRRLVARRIILHHDSMWVLRAAGKMSDAVRLPYQGMEELDFADTTHGERSETSVNDFLDRI